MRCWLLVFVAGCIEPATPICNGRICPIDKVCDPYRSLCVLPSQREACAGLADGSACGFVDVPNGVCDHETCYPAVCGDGFLTAGEVCDDANDIDGDGCSALCLSDERCGNGIVDVAVSESCDDANLVSGDGCSSTCTAEVASWHEVSFSGFVGYFGAEMAYDAARRRVVSYGGLSPTFDPLTFTFEYDGVQWEKMAAGPPGREGHALVYDAKRRAIVMFGGNNTMQKLAETWTYDGSWHPLVAAGPSARTGVGAAYDAARDETVVFGGEPDAGRTGETWVLAGSTWTQRVVAGPPARRNHRMAYDSVRQRVVLFGGSDGATSYADTWEWDGAAWQQVTTAATPSARGAMVFDAKRERIVLFGGHDTIDGTTWEYDGASWTPISGPGPSARRRASLAFDAGTGQIVLRCGTARALNMPGPPLADTWVYNGTWTLHPASSSAVPPQRIFAGFAYDTTRNRVLVAGGFFPPSTRRGDSWTYDGAQWIKRLDEPGFTNAGPPMMGAPTTAMVHDPVLGRMILVRLGPTDLETWTFDGASWSRMPTLAVPPPRIGFALAFDRSRGRVVLFGGLVNNMPAADTWELEGTMWVEKTPATSPAPRIEAAMAYDEKRQRVVLFGGRLASMMPTNETWLYDGATWTQLATTAAPAARHGAGIAYHAARGRVIIFGGDAGTVAFPDTWELGDTAWSQLVIFEGPGPRKSPHLTYDPARKMIVLYGGDPQTDTWELLFRSTLGDERCIGGGDEDTDGLVDCADPDCEADACGPNLRCTGGTCACLGTAEVRCGDGNDDDCDGAVDCADAECATTPLCSAEPDCTNADDDDSDGRLDCADPGCVGTAGCEAIETSCGDGADNDGDGKADCRDPDCFLVSCPAVLP